MSNIYEDPDVTLANMRFIKRVGDDGGERAERIVDIYESAGDQERAQKPRVVQSETFRALIVGVVGFLLVVVIIIMSKLYVQIFQEKHQLQIKYDTDVCVWAEGWRRFGCSCYYRSTEKRNWDQSRNDCLNREARLVAIDGRDEQVFVSEMSRNAESWIGLKSEKKEHKWPETCEWTWVDKTELKYHHWSSSATSCLEATHGSTAFIDLQGTWSHTQNGTKHWICEKQI